MNRTCVIAALLLLACQAWALSAQNYTFEGVNVYRIYPDSADIGQQAWVTFAFENTGSSDKEITLSELLGNAGFDEAAATATSTTYGTRWTYEWAISLKIGENTSVSYWIAPRSPGTYVLSPPELRINGKAYRMGSAEIEVRCNADGTCGPGETSFNCPQDCTAGSRDGTCEGTPDGKCDPDCASGQDADCAALANITQNASAKPPVQPPATAPQTDGLLLIVTLLASIVVLAAILWLMKKR